MPVYDLFRYEDSTIKRYKMTIKGPILGDYLGETLYLYSTAHYDNVMTSIIQSGKLDILNDRVARQDFIKVYLEQDNISPEVTSHPGFVIDFEVKNLREDLLDKVPKGMEYNIDLTTTPNLINKVLERYFPNDVELLNDIDINTLVYNLCKYPNSKATTLKEYINITKLKDRPKFASDVVVDNSITFNIYTSEKRQRVTITLPPEFEGNNMTLKELVHKFNTTFTIDKSISDCIANKGSIKHVIAITDNMHVQQKWYSISYALHLIKEVPPEQVGEILSIVHDDRVIPIDNIQPTLQELIIKRKVTYFSKYLDGQTGSKVVVKYFLYKLLNKTFTDNRDYWIKYKEACNIDTTKLISLSDDDWLSPLTDMGISDNTEVMKSVIKNIFLDKYKLKKDISDFYSLDNYYKYLISSH